MKRISSWVLAAMLLAEGIALAFPADVYSATVSSGTVKAKSGFVRASASTGATVSFCVSSGDEVAILGEEKGKDGKTWYRVSVGTNVGFIRSDLVSKTNKKVNVSDQLVKNSASASNGAGNQTQAVSNNVVVSGNASVINTAAAANQTTTAASAGTGTGRINGTSVRMRKNASVSSGVVTYMNTGDTVTIIAEGKASDGHVWLQVRSGDKTGFIRSDLVTKDASASSATSPVSAGTTLSAGTTITAGTTVTTSSPGSSDGSVKTVEPGQGMVKGNNVRIRSNASTAGNIVGTVSSGCELKLLGVEKATDREWVKVETTYQGRDVSGYIGDQGSQRSCQDNDNHDKYYHRK